MKTGIKTQYIAPVFKEIAIDNTISLVMATDPPILPGETGSKNSDPDKNTDDNFKTQFDE